MSMQRHYSASPEIRTAMRKHREAVQQARQAFTRKIVLAQRAKEKAITKADVELDRALHAPLQALEPTCQTECHAATPDTDAAIRVVDWPGSAEGKMGIN
jgi:hypothetical protein